VEADQKIKFPVYWYVSMAVIDNLEEKKLSLLKIVKNINLKAAHGGLF
jgi:hypothetical protein